MLPTSLSQRSGQSFSSPLNRRGRVDEEATEELRKVLGFKSGSSPAEELMPPCSRSSSGSSTIVPSSQFSSPSRLSTPSSEALESVVHDVRSESKRSSKAQHRGPWKQSRKVFVGGVPQSIDEDDLYEIFSKYGDIEKAWMQRQHDGEMLVVAPRGLPKKAMNHRGFGFVIFRDIRAITEALLGTDFARFVDVEGTACRFEVKRAVCANVPDVETLHARKLRSAASSADDCLPAPVGILQSPPSHQWLYPQVNGLPTQECRLQHVCSFAAPMVSVLQCAELLTPVLCGHESQLGAVAADSSNCAPSCDALLDVLLAGYSGPKPVSKPELSTMLLNALPEVYED